MTIQPSITGIDLGKSWFHVISLDRDGAVVLRKKLNRVARHVRRHDGAGRSGDGVLFGVAILGARLRPSGPRGALGAGAVCEAVREDEQE